MDVEEQNICYERSLEQVSENDLGHSLILIVGSFFRLVSEHDTIIFPGEENI